MSLVEEHNLSTEILVAGGGIAGICCGIAAARNGAKVILCQDRPVLGGNASSEVRMHIVGANGTGGSERGEELQTEAREGGIVEEIRLENSVRNPQRSASMFDYILHEKCQAEPNLQLLLNTSVVAAKIENQRITQVIAERISTEDRFIISADVFIDCTGDGRLAAEAGAEFLEGRESQEQFGESLAQETADQKRLGSTILMQARKHECPMPFVCPANARKFSKEELKLRLYATPGDEKPTHEYGYWWAEWGGELDTIKENEAIRDELFRIVMGIWDHVKNGPPGTPAGEDPFHASEWALDWFGFLPGKRESRRFIGQHVLTQSDLITSQKFEDTIAYGGWSLDLHPPEGIDAPLLEPCKQHPVPYLYDIPLRACTAKAIPNLMFAGRNISATHVAFSSTRVMGTCGAMGQGVGTAAATAVQSNTAPGELAGQPELIQKVQQQLIRDDAFLLGKIPRNENDLALLAQISASSEQENGKAINVISGQSRTVQGKRGAPPERVIPGTHRWMSSPENGLPVCLTLSWETPIQPTQVEFVFDTGLHRHLTLSQHDGYTETMHWGVAQPETIRDYLIEVKEDDHWKTILNVCGNYQRKRVHPLSLSAPIHSLRINVQTTNGLNHARICEVRVYGED